MRYITGIAGENIPVLESEDKLISNKLIAGNFNGLQGKITTESELLIIWGEAAKGGVQTFNLDLHFNSMIYVIRGEIKISGYGKVEKETLAIFDDNATEIELTADLSAQFLLLSGIPLNEKVVQQGPFVMNSETEILQAIRDYQIGKMGILIEEE